MAPLPPVTGIDIGIVAVLALALLVGWWRGLLRPLITWAFLVGGAAVSFGDPALARRFAPGPGWRPFMGLVVIAVFGLAGVLVSHLVARVVRRGIPVLGLVDRLAGAVVSGLLALVVVFIVLSAMVDGSFGTLGGLRAQMATSRVAPVVYDLGQRLPYLGSDRRWPSRG